MRRLLATLLVCCVAALGAAQAMPVQVFSRALLAPNDTVDWAQLPEGASPFSSPLFVASNRGITVTADDGVGFSRLTEGTSWIGDFMLGEALLWTSVDGTDGGTSTAMLLQFDRALQGFGFSIQPNYYGPFTATLQLFSDLSPLALFAISATSSAAEDGSAPYLGALDSVNSITGALITITSPSQNCLDLSLNCGFAINQLDLRLVPEPSGLALVVLAGLALVLATRRVARGERCW